MARKNYFALLELEFDPPEANERKFQKVFNEAFAQWEARLQDMLKNAAWPEVKKRYSDELALKDNIQAIMGEKRTRNLEAKALRDQRVSQLEELLDMILEDRKNAPEVTSAQLDRVGADLGLSYGTAEEVYRQKGFRLRRRDAGVDLDQLFLRPLLCNEIENKLRSFRGLVTPKYSWNFKVYDLYELACYLAGRDEHSLSAFRAQTTQQLQQLMKAVADKLAGDMSGPGHALADLVHLASTQVFANDAARKKYDQCLIRGKLRSLFDKIKAAPEEIKKDRAFAENCIKRIRKYFPDYGVALAIYNAEAGLMRDPYEPPNVLVHVACARCGSTAQFETLEEAAGAKCIVCDTPLYIYCARCGKKLPASADRCSCGYKMRPAPEAGGKVR